MSGGGGKLGPTILVCGAFFFHVHGKTVHLLNIQNAPIASTTFWENGTVFQRGHPEKWKTLLAAK